MTRSTVQDYLRRAAAKGLSYEQLSQLSDSEAQALLGKGQGQSTTVEEVIDFTQVHQELQRKGVTLMLLWQEGLDSAQWQCGYITARPRKPRDKSKVEKAVQEVERQILSTPATSSALATLTNSIALSKRSSKVSMTDR